MNETHRALQIIVALTTIAEARQKTQRKIRRRVARQPRRQLYRSAASGIARSKARAVRDTPCRAVTSLVAAGRQQRRVMTTAVGTKQRLYRKHEDNRIYRFMRLLDRGASIHAAVQACFVYPATGYMTYWKLRADHPVRTAGWPWPRYFKGSVDRNRRDVCALRRQGLSSGTIALELDLAAPTPSNVLLRARARSHYRAA